MIQDLTYTNGKGQSYVLCYKFVVLRSKINKLLYFYVRSENVSKYQACLHFPQEYYVWENPHTGMPLLKRRSQV